MRKLIMVAAVLLATAVPSLAQDYPSTEIFGGYSYLNTKPFGERTGMHGWGFSVTGNFGPKWGGVAEFSGNYGTTEFVTPGLGTIELDTSVYSFLFGPRISARGGAATGFGHVLLGGARLKLDQQSRTDFAMAIGAGVDINAGKSFAIRLGQADYFPNRLGGQWNSDFRFQAGVVLKLGGN
jgi:opacity protein-like surface antigen